MIDLWVRQDSIEVLNRPSLPLRDDGVRVVVVAVVFIILVTIAVTLRFYARWLQKVSYGLEDWSVLGSTILFYGYAADGILAVCIGGIGYHVEELSIMQLQRGLKILLSLQILYAVGLGLIKCSICLMLIRIFFVKPFRIAGYIVMAVCGAWSIMTILLAFLLCRPLDYNWNLMPTAGHCGNQRSAYAAVGITDIFTDIMILILPLPMVWHLQMPQSSKIALTAILSLGVFTIAASIARVVTIYDTEFTDFTFNTLNFCWPILEYGVAILVSCGPLLRPVFAKYTSFSFRSRRRATSELSDTRDLQHPGRYNFSHLSEPEIPLQSMPAPTSVYSITGNSSQHQHQMAHGNDIPKGGIANTGLGEDGWPSQNIKVERSWEMSARHV